MSRRKPKAENLEGDVYQYYIESIVELLKYRLQEIEGTDIENIYFIDATRTTVISRTSTKENPLPALPNSLILFQFPNMLYITRIEFKPSHAKLRDELDKIIFYLGKPSGWKTVKYYSNAETINNRKKIKKHIKNKTPGEENETDSDLFGINRIINKYLRKNSVKCIFIDTEFLINNIKEKTLSSLKTKAEKTRIDLLLDNISDKYIVGKIFEDIGHKTEDVIGDTFDDKIGEEFDDDDDDIIGEFSSLILGDEEEKAIDIDEIRKKYLGLPPLDGLKRSRRSSKKRSRRSSKRSRRRSKRSRRRSRISSRRSSKRRSKRSRRSSKRRSRISSRRSSKKSSKKRSRRS